MINKKSLVSNIMSINNIRRQYESYEKSISKYKYIKIDTLEALDLQTILIDMYPASIISGVKAVKYLSLLCKNNKLLNKDNIDYPIKSKSGVIF